MPQYYYLDSEEARGPFTLTDIYTLLDRLVITTATLVCPEGGPAWEPVTFYPELRGAIKPLVEEGTSSVREYASRRRVRSEKPVSQEPAAPGRISILGLIVAILLTPIIVWVVASVMQGISDDERVRPELQHEEQP